MTAAGEHFFPKAYAELTVTLIDTLSATLGTGALREVLAAMTDSTVARWAAELEGKPLQAQLEALRALYLEDDAYMEIAGDQRSNSLRLVERNCPFMAVAAQRPALCSVTVSTLSRLLGYRVTRPKRFQQGDGRCVFHLHLDQPLNDSFRFAFEDE